MATHVRPAGTSWTSVFGGWLAALGALAILLPIAALVTGVTPAGQAGVDDPMLAVPAIVAVLVAWIVGGYVAGRMAGYRRSWHGLMSAIWGLFVALVIALVAGGFAGSFTSVTSSMPRLDTYANATLFGFILGIAAVIIGGWLGGLLAPAPFVAEAPRVAPRERVVEQAAPVTARADREVERDREAERERDVAPEGDRVAARGDEPLVPSVERRSPEGDGTVEREEDAGVRP